MIAVADMIVIHFAFGSPFGVYQLARSGSDSSPRSIANVALHFAFWPVFALTFFQRWLAEHTRQPEITVEQRINALRSKLEEFFCSTRSTVSVLEFRELFTRFTDLTLSLRVVDTANPAEELLEISGHKNYSTASACAARRKRRKIQFHLEQIQSEFLDLLPPSSDSNARRYVIDLLTQLGHLLDRGNDSGDVVLRKQDLYSAIEM